MEPLTKRQREVLNLIEQYLDDNGCAPTLDEIGSQLGMRSMATVHKHVSSLEAKGYIRRHWNQSRAIEMVDQYQRPRSVSLPLLGRVAAGCPIEAIEHDDSIDVPESMVRNRNTYVLEVRGDSMVDDAILDGDYVVVEEKPDPTNGDVVVASIDGEATVKRFFRQGDGSVRLQPANPNFEPIVVFDRDLEIRGKVVGVLRNCR